jgi:tetratricopeptide (TPR) repeat protein
MASALKDQGNSAFAAKDYSRAIDLFSQAIALDSSSHVLYSNRSAAYAGNKQWTRALEDAEQVLFISCRLSSPTDGLKKKCIKLNPNWSKGYARKGAALHGAHRYDDAVTAYEAGLKLEDSPALRKGLKEVQDAKGKALASYFTFPPALRLQREQLLIPSVSGKCFRILRCSPNSRPIQKHQSIYPILPLCKWFVPLPSISNFNL